MTHSSSMNDCVQKIISATDQIFAATQGVSNPDAVREALICFDDVFHADDVSHRQNKRPLADRFARKTIGALALQFAKLSPSPEERHQFGTLSKAFYLIAKELDRNAMKTVEPDYHNRGHNMLVCAISLAISRSQKTTANATAKDLVSTMRRLVAALGHDFAHDGSSNTIDGHYEAGRLEMMAINRIKPLLDKAGVSDDDRLFIDHLILSTDPVLPANIIKTIHRQMTLEQDFAVSSPEELRHKMENVNNHQTHFALQALWSEATTNTELMDDILALQSADLVPSFGLSPKKCDDFSLMFLKEMNPSSKYPPTSRRDGEKLRVSSLTTFSVMASFLGLEYGAAKEGDQPSGNLLRNDAVGIELALLNKLNLKFLHPVAQHLFGGALERIRSICLAQMLPECERGGVAHAQNTQDKSP